MIFHSGLKNGSFEFSRNSSYLYGSNLEHTEGSFLTRKMRCSKCIYDTSSSELLVRRVVDSRDYRLKGYDLSFFIFWQKNSSVLNFLLFLIFKIRFYFLRKLIKNVNYLINSNKKGSKREQQDNKCQKLQRWLMHVISLKVSTGFW